MAVQEQTPYIEHTGNGVTTSFALKFQCESKDHLIVLVDEIEPPIATWSLTGGNVVFTTAPASGKKITLQRNTPFSRTTDYQSYNNSFRPPAVNKDFDWIWLKLQELGVADWILGTRIDALKNYVDRKDDELKAYLMEEIRKQGVALDQLDEYYNYLMERLAQIAVDKGWDASFVVDASGLTQQKINDLTLTPYHFGGIGDGTYHKLSEKYKTLEDAKKKYPTAQSLDDSIDLCALESFFNHCQDNSVNANITLNAYVNRPLELGMGAKGAAFKTLVYYGDLSLSNTQTDVEIPHLMRINASDTVWLGKLRFYGNTNVAVKDRKQLAGLVVGDGGTDGSAGRIQFRSITAFYFKCAGLVLANDSIFPRIDYLNIGWIGSTSDTYTNADGSSGGGWSDTVANHTATISSRTEIAGDYGQRSILTVSSLPPQYSIATEYAPRMVVFEGDNLPYVIKDIDTVNNTISVYPKLKNSATTNYNRLSYIYGTGLAWQGNNAGAGAFGHIQFITCGIGFWGGSLFGANINFLSTEWCGVGFTLGRAYETVIAYNINAGYFEANAFDYIQQWGNNGNPLLKLGISNNLNIHTIAEMQSYRFGDGDIRLQNSFDMSSIMFNYRTYETKSYSSDIIDLSDPNDVLNVITNGGGELQLYFSNFNFNSKFKLQTKTLVLSSGWSENSNNITLKAPEGWTLNGDTKLTLYKKEQAIVLTVTISSADHMRSKQLFITGESIYKPSGTTAERPANAPIGYMYLDTTLVATGKPIYKTATGWADGLGAVV